MATTTSPSSSTLSAKQSTTAYSKLDAIQHRIHTLIDYSKNELLNFTSLIQGNGIFVCLDMPEIMVSIDSIRTQNIKNILNSHVTGLSGISDLTAEMGDVTMGTDGNNFGTTIKTTGITKEITITLPSEVAGGIITNYMEELLRIVNDPDTGVSYVPNPKGLQFSPANHSFTFMWINVDPTYSSVNKAFLFQKAELTTVPNLWDGKKGEVSINELELTFNVVARNNRNAILKQANDILSNFGSIYEHRLVVQNGKFNV